VPGDGFAPPRIVYREIGGNRAWGNAVVALREGFTVEEVGPVRTRYGAARFHMLGTYPGTIIVGRMSMPDLDPITCVSVYGMIDVYAQTTMFRIVADLIPLFDSPYGDRVVLGGDFNITTATSQGAPEFKRYDAILRAVESLGLRNVVETAAVRPPQLEACACGASACHHLWTFGGPPGSQLDWLFATPELAHRCRLLEVERAGSSELSDHAPVIADFDLPPSTPDREWDPASFVAEVGARHGDPAGRIVEEIVAWAERKHHSLQRHGPDCRSRSPSHVHGSPPRALGPGRSSPAGRTGVHDQHHGQGARRRPVPAHAGSSVRDSGQEEAAVVRQQPAPGSGAARETAWSAIVPHRGPGAR
jgi:hypothetical protein